MWDRNVTKWHDDKKIEIVSELSEAHNAWWIHVKNVGEIQNFGHDLRTTIAIFHAVYDSFEQCPSL